VTGKGHGGDTRGLQHALIVCVIVVRRGKDKGGAGCALGGLLVLLSGVVWKLCAWRDDVAPRDVIWYHCCC
jgi:hypothetical protein